MSTYTVTKSNGDVTLANPVPEAEYMYGCVATSVGMLVGYYDLYGYRNADLSNLIEGKVAVKSRGTDGDAYDMDAFDTVLGRAIASKEYVWRFYSRDGYSTSSQEELEYTFKSDLETLNTDAWNCLADYLGTGQYWRGNSNLSTGTISDPKESTMTLKALYEKYYDVVIGRVRYSNRVISDGTTSISMPQRYTDWKHGLDLYVQSKGYSLDYDLTAAHTVDVNGGDFTFEDYMREIDAGRPVIISVTEHAMIGYGYNAETKEIIFDDCYQTGRMEWGKSYYYSNGYRYLKTITTVVFDVNMDLALVDTAGTSEQLLVAGSPDTVTTDDYIVASDDISQAAYLSYTIYNLGKKATKSFSTTIQVDGKTIGSDSFSSVESHTSQRRDNVSLGEMSVGLHTITVTIDKSTLDDYRVAERDILVLKPGTNVWSGSRTVENGESLSDIYMQKGGTLTVKNAHILDCILRGTAHVQQEGMMSGTSVYNTGNLQVYAGGTINETLVSSNGTITVSSGGIARATLVKSGGTLTVGSGGVAEDTTIGGGTVEVANGGTARNVSVEAGGALTVKSGGKVSGRLSAAKNASVVFQNGGIMDFNLSAFENDKTACINLSRIEGTPNYTITVSGKEKSGTYKLAEGAKGFDRTLSVKDTNGNGIGNLDVKGEFTVGNAVYQLNLNKNNLTLKVIANDPPTISKVKASITTPTVLDVVITAVFADDRGLAASLYKIGETGEWTPYEKKGVTVTQNAIVFFKAVDTAGNESEIVSYEVTNIDKSVLDNGNDNWLLDPKQDSPINPLVRDSAPTIISSGTKEILFDEDISLSQDGRRNYVGAGDDADFLKIKLDSAAKLVFSLDVMDAAKFIVYRLVEGQDKKGNDTYALKSLQTTSLSPKKNADSITGSSKPLYLESGEYYIAMRSSNAKKGGAAFYNIELRDDASVFFVEGDNSDDWDNLKESGADGSVGDAGLLNGTSDTVLDGWVGFGDTVDYAKITLEHAAKLNFKIDAGGASKFTVWQLAFNSKKNTYSLKSIKSVSVKAGVQAAVSVQLQASNENNMYYVSMAAANIKKFDSVEYHVGLDLETSVFYVDSDNGDNNWLYTAKTKSRNMLLVDSEAVNITLDTTDIHLDQGGTKVIGWDNYVGFGDEADYLKINLDSDAVLSFNITTTNAANFVIYSLTEKPGKKGAPTYSLKAVQKTTLKPGKGQTEVSIPTKAIALSSGDYYISMQSIKAKTGAQAYYNVSLNTAECSGLPGELLNAQDASALIPGGNDDLNFDFSISSDQIPMAGLADPASRQIQFVEYGNSILASI